MKDDLTVEQRIANIERNLDLCLNYCREMAKVNLSVEAIARIEGELANGHGDAE